MFHSCSTIYSHSNDFNFYPPKLQELLDREREAWILETDAVKAGTPPEEAAKLGNPLNEKEIKEKEKMIEQGFGDWNRRDFHNFVRGCEQFGRNDIASIAALVDGHTQQEVLEYAEVFWRRYSDYPGFIPFRDSMFPFLYSFST